LREYISKYLQGVEDYTAEDRLRMVRLIENVSMGVAFQIESVGTELEAQRHRG